MRILTASTPCNPVPITLSDHPAITSAVEHHLICSKNIIPYRYHQKATLSEKSMYNLFHLDYRSFVIDLIVHPRLMIHSHIVYLMFLYCNLSDMSYHTYFQNIVAVSLFLRLCRMCLSHLVR